MTLNGLFLDFGSCLCSVLEWTSKQTRINGVGVLFASAWKALSIKIF
jgi:hypothetical protein